MRPRHLSLLSVAGIAGAALAALILALAPPVIAGDKAPATAPAPSTCNCPPAGDTQEPRRLPKPKLADVRPRLDASDEIAALEAVHLALTEVGDGSAYVWHRRHGRLSGVVRPTASFRDANGQICRHIVLALSAEGYARSTEGVACRLPGGTWQLDG